MKVPDANPIQVHFTISSNSSVPDVERLQEMLSYASTFEEIHGELGIWLCTDEEIADLHLRFMNVSGATDVITFPEDHSPGGYLGDIAVSVETASLQATDAGHSPEREVAYLCLHGLLHIAGYGDLDEESRSVMIDRQDAFLHQFELENPGEW